MRGRRGARLAGRVRRPHHRHRAGTARGDRQSATRHRRGRGRRLHGRDPQRGRAAALPARRPHRRRRSRALEVPLPRPATRSHAAQPRRARDGELGSAQGDGAAGLHRDRDPHAHGVDAGGRTRVPGALAAEPRVVLRAAPEPAVVQAAADGRRARALLPDRAVPSRRGPARRSAVRVHATRRRSELRRPGGCPRVHQRGRARCGGGGHRRTPAGDRTHDMARLDEQVRRRQARPPIRHGVDRPRRGVREDRGSCLPGTDHQGHPCAGRGRAAHPEQARRARPIARSRWEPRAWRGSRWGRAARSIRR